MDWLPGIHLFLAHLTRTGNRRACEQSVDGAFRMRGRGRVDEQKRFKPGCQSTNLFRDASRSRAMLRRPGALVGCAPVMGPGAGNRR